MNNRESRSSLAGRTALEINNEARGTEGYVIAIQADVRNQTQVEYTVGEANQRYSSIDILVNNAMVGRYFLKPFLETTWDDFLEKFNDEINEWESAGHRTPEGKPIPTTRYGLLNLIAKKIKHGVNTTTLKIISAHNNDYTSTYTQSDRERIVKQKR